MTLSSLTGQVCLRIHLPELNSGMKPGVEDGHRFYFLSFRIHIHVESEYKTKETS